LLIEELLKMVINQILKHNIIQSAVNLYAGPIKQEKLLIINGCRQNQEVINISII
jgi:hypothetical protein